MTPNDTTSCQVKSQRVLTLFGLLVIIAMASLPLVVGPPPENGLPDLAKFIGRFHPVVLHLPIGIFVWVLVQECLNLFSKGGTQYSSRAAVGFAALSAIAASLLGFLLYYSMPDYDSEIAGRHLGGGAGVLMYCGGGLRGEIMGGFRRGKGQPGLPGHSAGRCGGDGNHQP